jgi:hypothetical protein
MGLIIFAGVEFVVVALFLVGARLREINWEAGEGRATTRSRSGYVTVLRRHRVGALSGR